MPLLRVAPDGFRLDGEPFRIISGGLHYFRVHPEQWRDRLRKARLLGLNTVETYVPWNVHEPRRGEFTVDGPLDVRRFLDLAAAEGLYVLLRPGPYICAEWEGGGLPSWLLREQDIRLRSCDPRYLSAVEDYFGRLLLHVVPQLGTRGGPVLAVQVENEFGAFGSDPAYLRHLVSLLRAGGVDVPLFTCDQPADLARGSLPGVLATANFGSDVTAGLAALRAYQPDAPMMCAEFWDGWFDRWGGTHVVRDPEEAAQDLDTLLAAGASVNLYMFHGGTNFGFTNGANDKHTYRPTVTSYDYDAPLNEAGDPTPKYEAFRRVIARHATVPQEPSPLPCKKISILGVPVDETASLLANAERLGEPVESEAPLTMEQLGQDFGFVLYERRLEAAGPAHLRVDGVRDRAQVFLDGQPVGLLERENHDSAVSMSVPRPGALLQILVENQGRVNYADGIHDRKGIVGTVLLNASPLLGWRCHPLRLDDLTGLTYSSAAAHPVGPAFHRGTFTLEETADTFVDLAGWGKGNVWINGFPLGRYWSRGPQRRLYVPGPVLRPGENEVVVLELHATAERTVDFVDTPDLGPVEE